MKRSSMLLMAVLVTAGISLFLTACKKDSASKSTSATPATNYATLTRTNIISADSTLSDVYITVSTEDGVFLDKGDIYIYKTKTGLYGKLQIDTIDVENNYAITFDATTYKADGSVSKEVTSLTVNGTWSCDMDNLVETSDGDAADFFLNRSTSTNTYIRFENNALFATYSFAK